MATPLDQPTSDDELYLGLGDDVDPYRPVFQGDLFRGISIAGYPAGDHECVAVMQHPCSMRRGSALRDRVAVVPVRTYDYVPADRWATGYTRVVPLPRVELDSGSHAAAILEEPGTIRAEDLTTDRRVGQLSTRGVLLFQQRVIYCSTHAVVGLDVLEDFSAPALAEAELLSDWRLELCPAPGVVAFEEGLVAQAESFEHYIRVETDLQARLDDVDTRADARRQIRAEIERRASEVESPASEAADVESSGP